MVVRLSKKRQVELKMLYDGGEGVTTFRIGAKIESPSPEAEVLKEQILAAAKVLKEAYKEASEVVWEDLSWVP